MNARAEKNEKNLMDMVSHLGRLENREIWRAEKMRKGAPDLLIETDHGLCLVELKAAYAKSSSKLFDAKQAHYIRNLNLRNGIVRACGLTMLITKDEKRFNHSVIKFLVDISFLPSTEASYRDLLYAANVFHFKTIKEAFDYIVHNF